MSKVERELGPAIGGIVFSLGVARLTGVLTTSYEYDFLENFWSGVAIYFGLWMLLYSLTERFREVKLGSQKGTMPQSTSSS